MPSDENNTACFVPSVTKVLMKSAIFQELGNTCELAVIDVK
jgi:hypothetical protein